MHLCQKEEVDAAVVDVTDDLNAEMNQPVEQQARLITFNSASSNDFPDRSPIEVQPGDDVIVIGYPLGLYDEFPF